MASTADLSVRQHERHACEVPVRIAVAGATAEAVRLTRTGADGPAANVVDFSLGGLGLSSDAYFPLTSELHLLISVPGAAEPMAVGVRVQRVAMTDRRPTYYIGTSFDVPGATPEGTERVLKSLRSASTGTIVEGPRA